MLQYKIGKEIYEMAGLGYKELQALIYGATFFGAGGGGSISGGKALLDELGQNVSVDMIEARDMRDGDWSTMVAGLGSPIAMKDLNFGPLALSAVQGMIDIARPLLNKNVTCIYSGEQGGFNTMVPIYAAAKLRMPILNLDANGRAVPELGTGLNPIYDIPLLPLVLSNQAEDITVGLPKNPLDSAACETLARTASTAYGGVGFSTWLMNRESHQRVSVLGQIVKSINTGFVLLSKPANVEELLEQLAGKANVRAKLFAEGTITKIDVKVEDGFDFGQTEITTGTGAKFRVDFKNENLIIWDPDNRACLVVPELIVLVNVDTMEPLSNADTIVGQRVALLGVPAPEQWWANPRGYTCWSNILKQVNYCDIKPAVRL